MILGYISKRRFSNDFHAQESLHFDFYGGRIHLLWHTFSSPPPPFFLNYFAESNFIGNCSHAKENRILIKVVYNGDLVTIVYYCETQQKIGKKVEFLIE